MRESIGGYRLVTPMQTTGSGTSRWCMAVRGGERCFLKEFLSPVYPAEIFTAIGQRQLERCIRFERKKQRLYAAASCVIGDVLVPVIDFFREDGHYYAVSEALPEAYQPIANAEGMTDGEKRKLLYEIGVCLQRLHAQGIVHADLKPEHVFWLPEEKASPRLIDLDSGFLLEERPEAGKHMEGDPVYLAPETFLCMIGEGAVPGTAVDLFSFGILIHQVWTGRLPGFDHEQYRYLYEAALDDADIRLDLPEAWQPAVRRMLLAKPDERPTAAETAALFAPEREGIIRAGNIQNSLSGLMKR